MLSFQNDSVISSRQRQKPKKSCSCVTLIKARSKRTTAGKHFTYLSIRLSPGLFQARSTAGGVSRIRLRGNWLHWKTNWSRVQADGWRVRKSYERERKREETQQEQNIRVFIKTWWVWWPRCSRKWHKHKAQTVEGCSRTPDCCFHHLLLAKKNEKLDKKLM